MIWSLDLISLRPSWIFGGHFENMFWLPIGILLYHDPCAILIFNFNPKPTIQQPETHTHVLLLLIFIFLNNLLHPYLYLYKYGIVCLSVHRFLGHFENDWDTLWHKVAFCSWGGFNKNTFDWRLY